MSGHSIFRPLTQRRSHPWPNEAGQSIVIITVAFLAMIAMLGLALDLGVLYIQRVRLKQAVDAATLAAVSELPNEEEAIIRAIHYLDQNGYALVNPASGQPQINIFVRGCVHDNYLSATNLSNKGWDLNTTPYLYFPATGVAVANPVAEFILDVRSYQTTDGAGSLLTGPSPVLCTPGTIFGTANKLHIDGSLEVDMNFMQFFGFREVPISDEAAAQNITSLDVSLVFDISGSMQFDTICHGCYEEYGDGTQSWTTLNYGYDYPITNTVVTRFPQTFVFPIPTNHLPATAFQGGGIAGLGTNQGQLCFGRDGNVAGFMQVLTQRLVVIEAELYTRNNSLYDRSFRQPGQGYWAVQHHNWRVIDRMMSGGTRATGATPVLASYSRGSWVSHHPFVEWSINPSGGNPGVPSGFHYNLAAAQANQSPSLEYEFFTSNDWNSANTRIWVRGQTGYTGWSAVGSDLYWAVYAATPGVDPFNPAPVGNQIRRIREDALSGPAYGGANTTAWRWLELTGTAPDLNLANNTKYTLKIWAGSPGYDLDQIVISNANVKTPFTADNNNTLVTATAGSAFGQACNRCNPIYGQTIAQSAHCLPPHDNGTNTVPTNNYNSLIQDELFGGYQPIRDTKEAIKRFVSQLNPQLDQVGIVAYNDSTAANRTRDLSCLRSNPNNCYSGSPITYTNVLNLVEAVPANGGTNIAQGMRDGLYLLGIDADNRGDGTRPAELPAVPANCGGLGCGRGAAAKRIMIVLTDGVANNDPNGACDDDPNLYLPNTGVVAEDEARDCVIYYAQIAANENVTIYTIGLGNGSDVAVLQRTAEIGQGQFFAAASPAKLDEIFNTILSATSVRLVE